MSERVHRTLTCSVVIACGAIIASCCSAPVNAASAQDFARLQRGRYLVAAGDCAACHTDSADKPFAGGKAIETPFGTVLSPNITPDAETGIGSWTDNEFDDAVRQGRLPNGKRLYPAMPYPYYTRVSQEDVRDILMYLRTLAPVRHEVESNQLPFPFRIRALMRFWNWLYFDPGPFKPDARRTDTWNRGAYLVQGLGHCGACHTPKTLLGGDKNGKGLQGYSLQGWFAPNITNDHSRGIGAWSNVDITEYLSTGHNRFAGASGPMAEEVLHGSSGMSSADLAAIADYLKGQPGNRQSDPVALPIADPRMEAGRAIYQDLCSACHRQDGHGVPYLIPDLAGSASVAAPDSTTVLRLVLQGTRTVATAKEPTAPAMPAFGWQLNDAQVAAVATYVRNSWGHAAKPTDAGDVHDARKHLQAQLQ